MSILSALFGPDPAALARGHVAVRLGIGRYAYRWPSRFCRCGRRVTLSPAAFAETLRVDCGQCPDPIHVPIFGISAGLRTGSEMVLTCENVGENVHAGESVELTGRIDQVDNPHEGGRFGGDDGRGEAAPTGVGDHGPGGRVVDSARAGVPADGAGEVGEVA